VTTPSSYRTVPSSNHHGHRMLYYVLCTVYICHSSVRAWEENPRSPKSIHGGL
jgi:hypothetical protein